MLLTHRKLLQSKAIASIIDLRGTLRNFGLKVGVVGMVRFEARIKELVENLPDLAVLVEPLLIVRRTLREQIRILDRRLLAIVRDDEVCRRLMTCLVSALWWPRACSRRRGVIAIGQCRPIMSSNLATHPFL
jgi:transposase